jgi:two-component system chemotaxis response regulator CheB
MAKRDIVVIGGSSGGLETIRTILSVIPGGFSGSIFVVLHSSPESPGILDHILGRGSMLPVAYAVDLEPIRQGHVYIAPPDRHLLVKRDHVRVTRGPRENRFRPAVDPLFRTAAVSHGQRVIAVVVSGGQDDGAVGLRIVKDRGGIAVVQDPLEALAPGMPQAAMNHVTVDFVADADEIGGIIAKLTGETIEIQEHAMEDRETRDIAEMGSDAIHNRSVPGTPSPITCPECGGALWESHDDELLQYQCHVGHRYSGESLLSAQSEALDHALWAGLRALEENSELRRRMANHARDRGMIAIAGGYDQQAAESEERAQVIRRVLMPEGPEPSAVQPVAAGADAPNPSRRTK